LAGILSRSIKLGSAGAEAASGAGCDGATVRLGVMAARCDEVSAVRGGGVSATRGGARSAGRAAGRGLAGASGVLAITLTSGRPTGLSSANTGSHAVSAAKLTALNKLRAIIRGRNTVARPPLPTSARILNPEESCTITGSTFEHPSRPVSLSPPIRTKKASGVTTETQAELAFDEEWRFHPPGRS